MRRFTLLCTLLLLICSLILGSASVSAKPGTSNKISAQKCHQGGYATLARTEDRYTAFTSETACTSYAAMGGTLVPFVAGPRVEAAFSPSDGSWCTAAFTGFNNPDTQYIEVRLTLSESGLRIITFPGSGFALTDSFAAGETVTAISAEIVGGVAIPVTTTPALPFACIA